MRHQCTQTLRVLFITCLLAGCTTTHHVTSFEETLKDDYVPMKEETWASEQADKFTRELDLKGLIYSNAEVADYIEKVEKRLLGNDARADEAIRIYVMRSPVPNAMALPNGDIYLNAGLFSVVETEDQLASIIAHEISHITKRHSVKSLISRKNKMVGAHIADLLTGGTGLVYLPAFASMMNYSRDLETEADIAGLKLLQNADYNPIAMRELIALFSELPGAKSERTTAYSSHPSQQDRIADITGVINANAIEPTPSARSDDFLSVKNHLMKMNVTMRLRARQFQLALDLIDKAEEHYKSTEMAAFYRGEAFHGFSEYPQDGAIEKYWIETGKVKKTNPYIGQFNQAVAENRRKAADYYKQSVAGNTPYIPAFKRLGELYQKYDAEAAINWYSQYLQHTPSQSDRAFVERMIQRLENK